MKKKVKKSSAVKALKKSKVKAKAKVNSKTKASLKTASKVNSKNKTTSQTNASAKAKKKVATEPKVALSNEKIGILGGAFNPVHAGHLNAALTVKNKLGLDRVVIMPALNPPHRQIVAPEPQDRLALVQAAIKNYEPELAIDDLEFKRGGTSYTFDTLTSYNKTHKAENIYFIMGADAFLDFPHWKNFEKLLSLANFVVVSRPGNPINLSAVDLPSGMEQFVKASDNNHVILTSGRSIMLVELDNIEISSTELRKRLRNGQDVSKWIPTKTLELIHERGLYKRSSPLVNDYREFALFCARSAFDKKAMDLKVYDMSAKNSYADYSIICSATSSKHGASVGEGVLFAVKAEYGLAPISVEGLREGMWVLLDYGTVVIHVFQDVTRQQYKIEDLWRNCPQIQKEVDPRLASPGAASRGATRAP